MAVAHPEFVPVHAVLNDKLTIRGDWRNKEIGVVLGS